MNGIRVKVLLLPVEPDLERGVEIAAAAVPANLHELINYLAEAYPLFKAQLLDSKAERLREHIRVAIDGRVQNPASGYVVSGDGAALTAGTEVVFFPAIAGG